MTLRLLLSSIFPCNLPKPFGLCYLVRGLDEHALLVESVVLHVLHCVAGCVLLDADKQKQWASTDGPTLQASNFKL